MNRLVTLFILVLSYQTALGQLTTTKLPEINTRDIEPYDSLKNFLGEDVYKYIGQDLYLTGMHQDLRKYGYRGFSTSNFNSCLPNCRIYKENRGNGNSNYYELEGKYFNVIAVHEHPESNKWWGWRDTYYLELEEKESGDTVYFEYSTQFEHQFPFIVVGFYEKLRKDLIGQKFVFGKLFSLDIYTGMPISTSIEEKWEVVDITVEEKYYELVFVFENSLNQTIDFRVKWFFDDLGKREFYIHTEEEANLYENRFGKADWLSVLYREVKVGFTQEMVLLSLGTPKRRILGAKVDQWVYPTQSIFFSEGEVVDYQKDLP